MSNEVILYQPDMCYRHLAFPGTSEKPERFGVVKSALEEIGCQLKISVSAKERQLGQAHSISYLGTLAETSQMGRLRGIQHAFISPHLQWYTAPYGESFQAAKYAAGAVCAGVNDVLTDRAQRVFCAVRPPGHHAGISHGEGFCILNNVAIGALDAAGQGAKVAIIDFDRHHGNGTEEIIAAASNSDLLFISSYQADCKYAKKPKPTRGRSKLLRIPLPLASDGSDVIELYRDFVFPAIERHRPDVIMISAGFDLHRDDALRPKVRLDTNDYRILTWCISSLANELGAGIVSVLEGGYTLESLKECVSAHVQALAD